MRYYGTSAPNTGRSLGSGVPAAPLDELPTDVAKSCNPDTTREEPMPNGGSDCCGTCWFNRSLARSSAGRDCAAPGSGARSRRHQGDHQACSRAAGDLSRTRAGPARFQTCARSFGPLPNRDRTPGPSEQDSWVVDRQRPAIRLRFEASARATGQAIVIREFCRTSISAYDSRNRELRSYRPGRREQLQPPCFSDSRLRTRT